MSWSLTIGRIAGTDVRLHITFILFLAWIFGASWAAGGPEQAWNALAFMILLFACVVAHEFGHVFAARHYGIATPDVTLLPIGGLARLERISEEPREEFVIAIAGPLVNVAIALVLVVFFGAKLDLGAWTTIDNTQGRDGRPAGDGQRVPGAVQPDPGVPDGRRPRAARAARHPHGLRRAPPKSPPRSARALPSRSASSGCSRTSC